MAHFVRASVDGHRKGTGVGQPVDHLRAGRKRDHCLHRILPRATVFDDLLQAEAELSGPGTAVFEVHILDVRTHREVCMARL